jgi:hypothetical protein
MSEWIDYSGDLRPVSGEVVVECKTRPGHIEKGMAAEFNWAFVNAYRIVNQSTKQATAPDVLAANDIQISGTHYKSKAIQPWDYIASNQLGFFEGNIVKYVTRWKDKGGVGDLQKARHYIDKLIELQEQA